MPPPADAELNALLTLHLLPGLGPRLTAALLEKFGSAVAVLQATQHELADVPYLGSRLAANMQAAIRAADVAGEWARIEQHGVHLLARGRDDYPKPLAEIHGPPPLLYVRGALLPKDANAVAVVGSRHPTPYGKRIAERLAGDLARAGVTIVSGLARGIDAAAHRGALQAGGRTLAVLAGGLARIYPPEHKGLAEEVAARGAVLSEALMDQEPLAALFPGRNRIISGLSRGVVLVEAAERSGALITADHAADQGRIVFAVPGPVDSPASAGTNNLLRQGATLIRGADDVLEELGGLPAAPGTPAPAPAVELDESQRRVWDFLADGPKHLDVIARALQLGVPQLTGLLLPLEMKKVVRRLPGNQYERRQ